jgi:hypothetical protein
MFGPKLLDATSQKNTYTEKEVPKCYQTMYDT